MKTLCIDIGGTGIKAIVLDVAGAALTERARIPTPQPAIPTAVLATISELATKAGEFDRVSVGFPGVVREGVTRTAPNLHQTWSGFPLATEVERLIGRPVRCLNDAAIQGLGVVEGIGFEIVITLGTGMGCGLYIDGKVAPCELAHHPFKKGKSYEERVSDRERKRIGAKRWNKRVHEVIEQLDKTFNYRKLYIGGGNARRVEREGLPANVVLVDNLAGLLGGIRLWA